MIDITTIERDALVRLPDWGDGREIGRVHGWNLDENTVTVVVEIGPFQTDRIDVDPAELDYA